MFYRSALRNILLSVPCALLLTITVTGGAAPAAAQDCQAALGSSSSAVTLTNGDSTNKTKRVDEWDGDVLKFFTPLPGVVAIEGTGSGSEGSLYTQGGTSVHPLVDSAYVGTGEGTLQAILPAGYHCIQVAPGPGATGDIEIEASFTDACHLGATDDHGDSLLCATPIDVDDTASGEISAPSTTNDYDVFTFVLTSAATIAIESSGSTDVAASLYDAQGALLEADDNSSSSSGNFLIVRSLSAGRYYVRVAGVNDDGAYGLGVSTVP